MFPQQSIKNSSSPRSWLTSWPVCRFSYFHTFMTSVLSILDWLESCFCPIWTKLAEITSFFCVLRLEIAKLISSSLSDTQPSYTTTSQEFQCDSSTEETTIQDVLIQLKSALHVLSCISSEVLLLFSYFYRVSSPAADTTLK